MRYIGVVVSKRHCQACIIDEEGRVIDEFPFSNNGEGIKRLLERVSGLVCKAVLESTGNL